MVIFPNLCYWRRSLCSNLVGIDPEKPYRATLNYGFQISLLQGTVCAAHFSLLNWSEKKYFDFFKIKLKYRSFFYKTQYQIHYELRRVVKKKKKKKKKLGKQTLPSLWRNPPNWSSPSIFLLLSQILSTLVDMFLQQNTSESEYLTISQFSTKESIISSSFYSGAKNLTINTVC